MRTWWVSLIALVSAAASAVPVWRWVDETGQVHYSDRPVPGAEQIELLEAQSFPSTAPRTPPAAASAAAEAAPQQHYRRFDVISPAQQETLWNIGSVLNVRLAVEPALQPGHRIDVYLDGQRRNLSTASMELRVPDVFRGVHTLQAAIFDADGNEVLRSLVVSINVQQTSIQNPNNPNVPARAN